MSAVPEKGTLAGKRYASALAFTPESLLREAHRQKQTAAQPRRMFARARSAH